MGTSLCFVWIWQTSREETSRSATGSSSRLAWEQSATSETLTFRTVPGLESKWMTSLRGASRERERVSRLFSARKVWGVFKARQDAGVVVRKQRRWRRCNGVGRVWVYGYGRDGHVVHPGCR